MLQILHKQCFPSVAVNLSSSNGTVERKRIPLADFRCYLSLVCPLWVENLAYLSDNLMKKFEMKHFILYTQHFLIFKWENLEYKMKHSISIFWYKVYLPIIAFSYIFLTQRAISLQLEYHMNITIKSKWYQIETKYIKIKNEIENIYHEDFLKEWPNYDSNTLSHFIWNTYNSDMWIYVCVEILQHNSKAVIIYELIYNLT